LFFASQLLENGTQETARLILTHEAQDTNMDEATFKGKLCDRIKVMFNCAGPNLSNLTVDVQSFAPGATITITEPIVNGSLAGTFTYALPATGSPNTIVVRAFYKWPIYVTQLGFNIGNLTGGKRLLSATAAFHVEP
jgi:Flp pilus assembly protein TadG